MLPSDPAGLIPHRVPVITGVTLNVVERPGVGVPVICLHGVWDWWRYWIPLVPSGAGSLDARQFYMLDLRGHGDSSKPASGYAWDDYASDVIAFIREKGLERVTLVGHSLGALTALLIASALPERVESLVLEDPPLPLRRGPSEMFRGVYEMRAQTFEQIVDDFTVWRPWTTREQAETSATCLLQTAGGVFQAMFDGVSDHVEIPVPGVTIDAPALVIRAGVAEQRALADEGIDLLREAVSNARFETLAGTSHTVLRDDPVAYRRLLADFLGS
ncbi:MAG TPA: alpha/beta hydrolase [Thermomicrobiales bacterium]|nr:alpha/beta hydrolase [Thermomicrobiales bacterium]